MNGVFLHSTPFRSDVADSLPIAARQPITARQRPLMPPSAQDRQDASRPIVLIGSMGAGKTTIGEKLAIRLGRRHEDTDAHIVRQTGLSVAAVFAQKGEAEFRRLERRVILSLLKAPDLTLSTGGGAFMDAAIRRHILASSTAIWLKADHETLMGRLAGDGTRPLLNAPDPAAVMRKLCESRDPVYALAPHRIDANGSIDETMHAVIDLLIGIGLAKRRS